LIAVIGFNPDERECPVSNQESAQIPNTDYPVNYRDIQNGFDLAAKCHHIRLTNVKLKKQQAGPLANKQGQPTRLPFGGGIQRNLRIGVIISP
jgi:hypothetical protein